MQTTSATSSLKTSVAPLSWRVLALLLCVFVSKISCADTLDPRDNQQQGQIIFSFSTSQVKQGFVWLRDATAKRFAPMLNPFRQNANLYVQAEDHFATEYDLFKPLGDDYRMMLDRAMEQQVGVQVRDNVRLQWDLDQYWTANDRREVGLKLGLHFGFR